MGLHLTDEGLQVWRFGGKLAVEKTWSKWRDETAREAQRRDREGKPHRGKLYASVESD